MISLERVAKVYKTAAGTFSALYPLDLEIDRGKFAVVIGKSGSGKSTLLNLIGGIDRPSSGTIRVGGKDVHDLTESDLASWRGRNVGFVFQFFQLLPTLTAAENVMLPMDFCGIYPVGQRRSRAMELLAQVGVSDQADKLPATLSGGQQQRVAVARALANNPAMVIADEPTGNLDSTTGRQIMQLLHSLTAMGTTVVIATHERDVAHRVDYAIELSDGKMVRNVAGVQ